jgi:phage shock protein C
MIAGVCGGIGEYFDVDATIIRVVAVALALLLGGFGGLILYGLCWLIIPEEPLPQEAAAQAPAEESDESAAEEA